MVFFTTNSQSIFDQRSKPRKDLPICFRITKTIINQFVIVIFQPLDIMPCCITHVAQNFVISAFHDGQFLVFEVDENIRDDGQSLISGKLVRIVEKVIDCRGVIGRVYNTELHINHMRRLHRLCISTECSLECVSLFAVKGGQVIRLPHK